MPAIVIFIELAHIGPTNVTCPAHIAIKFDCTRFVIAHHQYNAKDLVSQSVQEVPLPAISADQ
uniref:Uncharacterized protein n=1 Tax=Romanomermis culicivorax TaxID=13658 RepID=A0A915J0K9_ROMCU